MQTHTPPPWNSIGAYLQKTYGTKIHKISIDTHLNCPNRDGKCGYGGCIFCDAYGSGEKVSERKTVNEQVKNYFEKHRYYPAGDKYIVYFQNYSGTYAPIEKLKELYLSALIDPRIVVLDIATRPDCVDEHVVDLLSQIRKEFEVDVWVELGLQTESNETAERINRGYETNQFDIASNMLAKQQIPVIAHMMVGLPGEDEEQAIRTADFLGTMPISGIKIHSTYVLKNTKLCRLYELGEYQPLTEEQYAHTVARILNRLPSSIVVHRLTGEPPKESIVVPQWTQDKDHVLLSIRREMIENGWSQGGKTVTEM